MILNQDEALARVSQRVYENTKSIKQNDRQRRDRVVDIYGAEFYRVGDGGSPARFYISVSLDMVYIERFQFKLIIQPFLSTAGSGTSSAIVNVNETRLTSANRNLSIVNNQIDPNPHNHTLTPNPHTHTTDPHTHNIVAGITQIPTTANDFRLSVEGIDVTPYLAAQGKWIDGEGVFPSLDIEKNYDLLEVASDLIDEGREEDANRLLRAGYKPIEISSGSPFSATMSLYLKYSHANR